MSFEQLTKADPFGDGAGEANQCHKFVRASDTSHWSSNVRKEEMPKLASP